MKDEQELNACLAAAEVAYKQCLSGQKDPQFLKPQRRK
jgi:hypothetical protein